MYKYRLTCNIQSKKDWRNSKEVSIEAIHPDMCKAKLAELYPGHAMSNIRIENLTPQPKPWRMELK